MEPNIKNMFKPKKQMWRDNTEPPKNYIWERLNESGSYIGTYEYNGSRWVRIRDKDSNPGSSGNFVYVKVEPKIVYANDKDGKQTSLKYSENADPDTLALRTVDGRIKSASARENNDVVTFQDIC